MCVCVCVAVSVCLCLFFFSFTVCLSVCVCVLDAAAVCNFLSESISFFICSLSHRLAILAAGRLGRLGRLIVLCCAVCSFHTVRKEQHMPPMALSLELLLLLLPLL